jgi:hypothetical protein
MRLAGSSLVALGWLLLGACGGGIVAAPPPDERPAEAVCTLGTDPSAHLAILPPRTGGPATVDPGAAPLSLDITGDGTREMAFVARTATDRWLMLLGCQDFAVAVLGAFKMPGLVGDVRLEPFVATRAPVRELKVTLTIADRAAAQEFWAYFGFDGADLGQEFSGFVSRIPPQGDATRAAITFSDEDGDGTNEIRVVEEVLEGDGARARLANASAPLPRIQSVRTLRFRFDTARRTFGPVE